MKAAALRRGWFLSLRNRLWTLTLLLAGCAGTWCSLELTQAADGVLLVNSQPLPAGSVIREVFALKLGGDGSNSNAGVMQFNGFTLYEFHADGSIGVLKPIDRYTGGSSAYEPTPIEGMPITGKKSGDQWIFESSTSRDDHLNFVRSPESSDQLYPSRPLKVGDRWQPDPKAWVAMLRDRGITQSNLTAAGWMELWSLSGQAEHPCATIHFDVTASWPQDNGSAHFSGFIVRSLKCFQDLSITIRGNWIKDWQSASTLFA